MGHGYMETLHDIRLVCDMRVVDHTYITMWVMSICLVFHIVGIQDMCDLPLSYHKLVLESLHISMTGYMEYNVGGIQDIYISVIYHSRITN